MSNESHLEAAVNAGPDGCDRQLKKPASSLGICVVETAAAPEVRLCATREGLDGCVKGRKWMDKRM